MSIARSLAIRKSTLTTTTTTTLLSAKTQPRVLAHQQDMSLHPQQSLFSQSIVDRESFWLRAAKGLHWHLPPTIAFGKSSRQSSYAGGKEGTWFPNATINTCFNCLDRHVYPPLHAGSPPLTPSPVTPHLAMDIHKASRTAFHHVSPLSFQQKQYTKITYGEALDMVQTLSGVLKHRGVRKGDVVSFPPLKKGDLAKLIKMTFLFPSR